MGRYRRDLETDGSMRRWWNPPARLDVAPPVDPRGEPDESSSWTRTTAPSYMAKLAESQRRRSTLASLGYRQRIWNHNGKRDGYLLAEKSGVAVPQTFARLSIDDLDFAGLPERFVIKPDGGATNRGVFLLIDQGDGSHLDLMDGRRKSADEVVKAYRAHVESGNITPSLSVEELLRPRPDLADCISIPDDFKVYCFYDRPAVVMQRRMFGTSDRTKWRFKFWDSNWVDLGPVKFPDRLEPALAAPAGASEIIEAARRIGVELAYPFARLDFYDTERGVVFGEVTPHPGPPEVWRQDLDEMLGHEWELSEARLSAAGVSLVERSGGRSPETSPPG
jgi:hypothetical protein